MVDENGNTAVTGVYTHDSKTGRLFGINDFTGWVMYSDDDGATWQKYNKESINKWQASPYLETLSYDSKNDKLYVAWGWTQLSVITNNGNTVTNITENIPKMLQFEGAPTKEQIGSNYSERRIRCVAVDPNNPDIIYAGGGSYTYQGDSSLYRSCDGGKTWKVVSINGTNSIVSTKNGDYGGVEPTSINVKPDTGELWASGNCTGLSKLTPPYIMKQNNSQESNDSNSNSQQNDENKSKDNQYSNKNRNVQTNSKSKVTSVQNNKEVIIGTTQDNSPNIDKTEIKDNKQSKKKSKKEQNENIQSDISSSIGKRKPTIFAIIIFCIISIYSYIKYKK